MKTVRLDVRPDPDDVECADVYAPVVIDGMEHLAVVDTGAARSQLTADEPIASGSATSGLFGHLMTGARRVDTLEFGPITVRDLEIDIVSCATPGLRNLVGLDVIGRAGWTLDLATASMTPRSNADMLEREYRSDRSGYVWLDVVTGDGATASAVWDTGAGMTVVDAGYRRRSR